MGSKQTIDYTARETYESGLWVPSYYGLRFCVARERKPSPGDIYGGEDREFICNTVAEAVAECDRRNMQQVAG